jgi:hypothetical protein
MVLFPAVIDPEVLDLALEFENACNPFLQQAAVSLLIILEDNGLLPTRGPTRGPGY